MRAATIAKVRDEPGMKKNVIPPLWRKKVGARFNKAIARQKKSTKQMRASIGEPGLLESNAFSDNASARYTKEIDNLCSFAVRHMLPKEPREKPAVTRCKKCGDLFLDGYAAAFGDPLRAAVERWDAKYARHGFLTLPRFMGASRGGRKSPESVTGFLLRSRPC